MTSSSRSVRNAALVPLTCCPQRATAATQIKYLTTMNRVLLKASEIFLSAFLPMLDDSSRQRCWDELQACAVQYTCSTGLETTVGALSGATTLIERRCASASSR